MVGLEPDPLWGFQELDKVISGERVKRGHRVAVGGIGGGQS